MKATFYLLGNDQPVNPTELFGALLSRSPIADCVWQEHACLPILANDGEVLP